MFWQHLAAATYYNQLSRTIKGNTSSQVAISLLSFTEIRSSGFICQTWESCYNKLSESVLNEKKKLNVRVRFILISRAFYDSMNTELIESFKLKRNLYKQFLTVFALTYVIIANTHSQLAWSIESILCASADSHFQQYV